MKAKASESGPRRPGMVIGPILDKVPLSDRPELIAYLEQSARREADLELLRALKDYRQLSGQRAR